MIVLVTGAAGFVGRYVARQAAASGWRVIGLGHNAASENLSAWGVHDWREGDVTLESVSDCAVNADAIIHCAGGASVAASLQDPVADFRRTVDSTLAVLEAARLSERRPTVVIPSSAAVYGATEQSPLAVGGRMNPISPYGQHKKMAEDLAVFYARQRGVRVGIVRLFSVFGPGLRKQLLWDACSRILAGDALFAGTGEETRDWLHVEDAARLILEAQRQAASPAVIVNGGSGRAETVGTVLRLLADALPTDVRPRFSGILRPGDPTDYRADVDDALAWGWVPKRTLADGLADYAEWYLNEADL